MESFPAGGFNLLGMDTGPWPSGVTLKANMYWLGTPSPGYDFGCGSVRLSATIIATLAGFYSVISALVLLRLGNDPQGAQCFVSRLLTADDMGFSC